MAKLEGIIYKTFNHYVVLRGFAAISHKPISYQRPAIDRHKKDIVNFLDTGEYKYFPEITLACRTENYTNFASNIGIDDAVDRDDAQFVSGLKVLSERLPYDSCRARHANLTKNNNQDLVRVDGNHRLEPFDSGNEEFWNDTDANKKELGKLIVPYTVIFSEQEFGDKFEAGIFHNINFRQEPLREEASLKIISDLNVFEDKEKLGAAYPLALNLIEKVKSGIFDSIYWLKASESLDESFYRTTCLRIAQRLLSRKDKIEKEMFDVEEAIKLRTQEIDNLTEEVAESKVTIQGIEKEVKELEINNANFKDMSTYRQKIVDLSQIKETLNIQENKKENTNIHKHHLEYKKDKFSEYINRCENVDEIVEAIHQLKNIYYNFEKNQYGNIAMLVAMVHYALLNKAQLNVFVNWAKENGVNKIVIPDDLSKDASENLISMFEQIYQSKKNEIFVSMQFGDSQSELIYEKVVRAIEKFNTKHKTIHLNVRPIRIDRTIESSSFSIPEEILKAIASCSLIIADLSSANINVYHEIGYAMGVAQSNSLLPNIILLYKEDTDHNKEKKDIDKYIGFNLRNLSQLRFKDYKQLTDGLLERLEKHFEV